MVERIFGKKVIGIKQSTKSIKNGEGRVLYVANDAEDKLVSQIVELAGNNNIEVRYVNTMKDLGKLCGIDVGAAVALLLEEQ
jgi:large subunit ribosomal protein L7A